MSDAGLVDPQSGAIAEGAEQSNLMLVPLHLAALDENALLEQFPTPVQAAGALLMARKVLADAPAILYARSKALKDAKRQLLIAHAYARKRADGRSVEERKVMAYADPEVISAGEWVDTCELALEYARDVRKSTSEDIEILRSLNANFRDEHKR